MKPEYLWFATAVALVIAELMTSTFYLLMLAIGITVGGMAVWQGASTAAGLGIAALVSVVAVLVLRRLRPPPPAEAPVSANPNLQIDIGQTVWVEQWQHGTARVLYRGTHWDAEMEADHVPQPGQFVITAVKNNRLVLAPVLSPAE